MTESRSTVRSKNSGLVEKLSRTRTTDLSVSRSLFAWNKKEEERYESGEGANTVISVVKAILYIIFVLVISVFLALGIIVIGNDIFAFVKSDEIVEVTIPEYATLDDVAQILYQNDIIRYPQVFKLYAVAEEDDQKYLAGTYSVNGMMNYDTLLETFKEKKPVGTIKITIPEGYTTDEIIDLFVSKGMGTKEGFVEVIQNYDYDYWFIDLLEAEGGMSEDRFYRLDGYLFPDTYEFYLSSPERDIIGKLLKRFAQIFNKEYRAQCETMGYTVDQVITLASIIEKEAASPAEFFNVSSVFHNRLNQPWNYPYLESDATIVYAIQHEEGERVVLKGTTYETPYNTYLHKGLPPGPIANPSASAMLAALQPTDTEFYFFIADGGKTYFSKTRDEHNAYVAQFRDN